MPRDRLYLLERLREAATELVSDATREEHSVSVYRGDFDQVEELVQELKELSEER